MRWWIGCCYRGLLLLRCVAALINVVINLLVLGVSHLEPGFQVSVPQRGWVSCTRTNISYVEHVIQNMTRLFKKKTKMFLVPILLRRVKDSDIVCLKGNSLKTRSGLAARFGFVMDTRPNGTNVVFPQQYFTLQQRKNWFITWKEAERAEESGSVQF